MATDAVSAMPQSGMYDILAFGKVEAPEVLQGSTLADLSSPYLNRGLSKDEHEISRVEIRNKHLEKRVDQIRRRGRTRPGGTP